MNNESGFAELGLSAPLLKRIKTAGFDEPTPIQHKTIPSILMNRDVVGVAQTGTGKTAAFVLPMVDILAHGRVRNALPRALILNPTRELAMQTLQVAEQFGQEYELRSILLIGGMTMAQQIKALARPADIVIATPGRLIDLHERGKLLFNAVHFLVIDEADRMLDMGFIPDVERICTLLPKRRQTILMTATLDNDVKKIVERFSTYPKHVDIAPPQLAADTVSEEFILDVEEEAKIPLLVRSLRDVKSALIFCNRRQQVRAVTTALRRKGLVAIGQLHGELSQPQRIAELERFRENRIDFLVCSDVASRGLDIEGVDCVVNFDVPASYDTYVHRIGRTGRAGRKGRSLTFATSKDRESLARSGLDARAQRFGVPAASAPAPSASPASQLTGSRARRPGLRKTRASSPSTRPLDELPAFIRNAMCDGANTP